MQTRGTLSNVKESLRGEGDEWGGDQTHLDLFKLI